MARTVADCALAYAVLTGTAVPRAGGSRGLRVGRADGATRTSRRSRPRRRATSARSPTPSACARSARDVQRGRRCPCRRATRGRCSTPRRPRSHAATFPSRARRVRADDPGQARRTRCTVTAERLPSAGRARAARVARARRARARRRPASLSPTLGVDELPPAGVDELDVRLRLLGLHAPVQLPRLAGDRDRRPPARRSRRAAVIAAALALERDGKPTACSVASGRHAARPGFTHARASTPERPGGRRLRRFYGGRASADARASPAPRLRADAARGVVARDRRCRAAAPRSVRDPPAPLTFHRIGLAVEDFEAGLPSVGARARAVSTDDALAAATCRELMRRLRARSYLRDPRAGNLVERQTGPTLDARWTARCVTDHASITGRASAERRGAAREPVSGAASTGLAPL